MSVSAQEYVATATERVAEDFIKAFERIPEDKRHWSPAEGARSAADQLAEIALLNGSTANLVKTKSFPADFDMAQFFAMKGKQAQDIEGTLALLKQNTATLLDAVRSVSDDDLGVEIQMPWGLMTVRQIMGYPLWNMSYHEGQINYIASILGCLP